MQNLRFDWRWLGVIVVVALLANSAMIPWQIFVVGIAAAGSYLFVLAWREWQGGAGIGDGKREVYWRGERIELPAERNTSLAPSNRNVGATLLYGALGAAMWLGAIGVIFNQLGL